MSSVHQPSPFDHLQMCVLLIVHLPEYTTALHSAALNCGIWCVVKRRGPGLGKDETSKSSRVDCLRRCSLSERPPFPHCSRSPGGGRKGVKGESNVEMDTLPYVKSIAGRTLLYDSGSSNQDSVTT